MDVEPGETILGPIQTHKAVPGPGALVLRHCNLTQSLTQSKANGGGRNGVGKPQWFGTQ